MKNELASFINTSHGRPTLLFSSFPLRKPVTTSTYLFFPVIITTEFPRSSETSLLIRAGPQEIYLFNNGSLNPTILSNPKGAECAPKPQ
jgi:hypothetical protein